MIADIITEYQNLTNKMLAPLRVNVQLLAIPPVDKYIAFSKFAVYKIGNLWTS